MKKSRIFDLNAFFIHLFFSVILLGVILYFIVKFWYPGVLAIEIGGYKLISLILFVSFFAGPICVGFTYKPHKSKKTNAFDTAIVTLCQLAFLGWGIGAMSSSRPVFIVFEADRFDLIINQDIEHLSLFDYFLFEQPSIFKGIQMAVVDLEQTVPDERERIEINNSMLFNGLELTKIPKYYVAYAGENLDKIFLAAKGYDEYTVKATPRELAVRFLKKHNMSEDEFRWLPIRYYSPNNQEEMFMTAVINHETAEIIDYITIDPYEI